MNTIKGITWTTDREMNDGTNNTSTARPRGNIKVHEWNFFYAQTEIPQL